MSSLLSLLGKLSRYLTGARAPSVMNVEFKNRFIFPEPPRGAQYLDHGYVPWELLDAIQQDRDAVDGIGHIYISSVKYCKKEKGAQHEFLVFTVKDNTCNYRQNDIIIDRVVSPGRTDNRDTPPANVDDLTENDRRALRGESIVSNSVVLESNLTSSYEPVARGMVSSDRGSSISNSFIGVPALDMCRVSAHGGFKGMTARLVLTPYKSINELTFTDDSFTLEKLLNLAATLSNHEPGYDLFKTQCYWYALMLWELVQRVSGKAASPFTTVRPGSNRHVPWLLAQTQGSERQRELDELVVEYEKKWGSFLEELPHWKDQGVKALNARIDSRPTAPAVAPIVPLTNGR
ncbi:unnamed protein product [Rhizoctonia solani]|uniref:Uncharacterized protein n=1 Tax=Rhizoctonia solani TaxID=456999 RepID=A0A8H3GMN8_9AGAM|nr:unnamed protein product [Rhizoctonia solani]